MPVFERRAVRAAVAIVIVTFFAGCASTLGNPRDPFEPVNRGIYRFNEVVDNTLMKPVAETYRTLMPSPIRTGVSNFFANLSDILNALNNLLQGKVADAANDFGRIVINTTFGLGGVLDVATVAGLDKHDEDFGQTLGRWGFDDGPFLMLPLFGPSSMRDGIGRIVDYHTHPLTYVRPRHVRNIMWGVNVVNRRAELLDAGTILETAALDPYEFIRDAYLQRRRNLVYDGNPPVDKDLDLDPVKPRSEDSPAPAASRETIAMPALSPAEIESLVQSLPPTLPARRTARASVVPASDL